MLLLMNEKKFAEVFSDDEFVNKLLNLDTGEKVIKALAEKGIKLTPEDLDEFAKILVEALEKNSDLKIEDLSKIHGGSTYNVEKIQKHLKVNDQELKEFLSLVNKVGTGELSDDVLEKVSGGHNSMLFSPGAASAIILMSKIAKGLVVLGVIGAVYGTGYAMGRRSTKEITN